MADSTALDLMQPGGADGGAAAAGGPGGGGGGAGAGAAKCVFLLGGMGWVGLG